MQTEIDYGQVVYALLFVVALIGLLAYAARRLGFVQPVVRAPGSAPSMKLVDAMMLDPRRRLVVVERDKTQYVLLLGPTQDVLLDKKDA